MRYYEIVILFDPDHSEQLPATVERYQELITKAGGMIHRYEDWGRRQLAYPIDKFQKAHYILFNLEISMDTLAELENQFRYNDKVIRTLVMRTKQAINQPSPIAKPKEERPDRRNSAGQVAEEGHSKPVEAFS
ncbi:MAG: 30S ribosomal protein S6 [Candidatus Symbiodolus clandestinus]